MQLQFREMDTKERGFTLVEMIVAVALFSIVMVVAVGALLSLTGANKKAQALQSVMNNLNIALDGMVREIRQGTVYHCGAVYGASSLTTADCSNGDHAFAFEPYGDTSAAVPWVYEWAHASSNGQCSSTGQANAICRSTDGGNTWEPITAPEVDIQDMAFYVVGSSNTDNQQPKVVIVVKGSAGGLEGKVETTFHIQATAVQRVLDLP